MHSFSPWAFKGTDILIMQKTPQPVCGKERYYKSLGQ